MAIGKKIRELRQQKGWTLADLSKRSRVALSSLSRMETGRMTGTLESHIAIVRALGVRLNELYADLDPLETSIEHKTGSSTEDLLRLDRGVGLTLLSSGSLKKKMLPALMRLTPGKLTQKQQFPVGVEVFIYLLKGRIESWIGKEKVMLNPGDSLYFPGSLPHQFKSLGGAALALKVSSPPTV